MFAMALASRMSPCRCRSSSFPLPTPPPPPRLPPVKALDPFIPADSTDPSWGCCPWQVGQPIKARRPECMGFSSCTSESALASGFLPARGCNRRNGEARLCAVVPPLSGGNFRQPGLQESRQTDNSYQQTLLKFQKQQTFKRT